MKRTRMVVAGSLLLLLSPVVAWSGDGVVALQTADPSCADDSGDIYVDCGNGTVTDNRTGLVWLANADCIGPAALHASMEFVAGLADIPPQPAGGLLDGMDCGLSDHSSPGEWRLPAQHEWQKMISDALGAVDDPDCTSTPPTLTNDSGLECLVLGPSSFLFVQSANYWSSTPNELNTLTGLGIGLDDGHLVAASTANAYRSWPVRGGQ